MAKCLETSEFERHRGDGSCNYSARERRALPAEGGRVNSASILKRLEQLEQTIRFRHPRIIVLTVPTDASTGKPTAETEAAVNELHQQLGVTDSDLVVHVANYSSEPEQFASLNAPLLASITQQC